MTGTLYGLGIGPGDPELMTLKALRLLRRAPVIAYIAPEGLGPDPGDSLARAIVAPHLPGGQVEIRVPVPMRPDPAPARAAYDRGAAMIADHLAAGRDVAALCEGDPFFYGSFQFLFARLAGRFAVEIVPGVSSLTAGAAALAWPLAARNDVLSVLPAPLDDRVLRAGIAAAQAVAIIKLGRHFGRIRALLESLGLDRQARYIERASLAGQRILPLAAVAAAAVPYFSMILVHPHEGGGP